jgi:negative regulator of replication initiation
MDGPLLVEVTIPSIGADPLIVEINNDRYSYRAGETYEVPEDVAAVINNLIASMPSKSKPSREASSGGTKIKGVYDESLDSVLLTSVQIADLNQLYVEIEEGDGSKTVTPVLFGMASTYFRNTSYAGLVEALIGEAPDDIYYYDDEGTSHPLLGTDVTDFTYFQDCNVIAGGKLSSFVAAGIKAMAFIVIDGNNHVVYWTALND